MLTYDMEGRGEKSLYGYLYERIRADIESGAIAPQQKLPSKRELAKHLGVSLITVEGAYSQLVAEGYVLARQRKGYYARDLGIYVADAIGRPSAAPALDAGQRVSPGQVLDAIRDPEASQRVQSRQRAGIDRDLDGGWNPDAAPAAGEDGFAASAQACVKYDFTGASPVPGLFPYGLWAKTMRQVLSRESETGLLDASSAQGSLALRCAISDYLRGFRGMDASPAQIVVGAGAQVLYQLIIQLLGRERAFAVEDPGYPRLTSVYSANDVPIRHIPLDCSGVSMAHLRASNAQVLHFMPSHQYPTGLVTPIARRREVLEWAAEVPGRYIIEDDYDCEFRLAGRPIPSLQSIDSAERVIYANTFTRSIGASFRFGYMVLPPHLARLFQSKLGFYSNTVSALDQLALAEFMRGGFYERHVNRLRSHYRKVQQELVDSFTPFPQLMPEALDSGLHFILGVRLGGGVCDPSRFEAAIEGIAREQGIAVRSLSGCRRAAAAAAIMTGAAAGASGRAGVAADDADLDASSLGRDGARTAATAAGADESGAAIGGIPLSERMAEAIQEGLGADGCIARFVIGLTGIPLEEASSAGGELARLISREIG